MREWRSVPLGVDLGTTRLRIALGESNRLGEVRLRAIAARDLPADTALIPALLEEALEELGVRERRCVLALGAPHAEIRSMRFPRMTWAERLRAARYEAPRIADWQTEEEPTIVRVHPSPEEGFHAIGVARAMVMAERVACVRSAGLRVVAVDHDAFALARHLRSYEAIVDIGLARVSLHGLASATFPTLCSGGGASVVTRGIAEELGIDLLAAERRKRILGCAGAGIAARHALVAEVAALVDRMRSHIGIERIALTGNGARLPSFAKELEDATGALVEMPVPPILQSSEYPEDVLRFASPDWSLAVGLLDWSLAG